MEEALIKRILPHSIEAEQSVIGSMILDRDAILVRYLPVMIFIRNNMASSLMQWWNCVMKGNR